MPSRRANTIYKLRIDGKALYLTLGLYEDGSIGEIFLDIAKCGEALRFWTADAAIAFSIALQNGTPLEDLVKTYLGSHSQPAGCVEGHPAVEKCTSIMDCVSQILLVDFLTAKPEPAPVSEEEEVVHRKPFVNSKPIAFKSGAGW